MSQARRPAPTGSAVSAPRSPAEIEAEIDEARNRLAGTINDLQYRLSPATIVKTQKAKARAVFVDESGGIRVERVAAAVGVVVGLLVLRSLVRRVRG